MSIRQDEFTGVAAETLSVVRAKLNVLEESSVGVIATDGSPRVNAENSLAGFDFLYRNTRLPGGRTLEAEAWVQQSETENLDGNDAARGIGIRLPSSDGDPRRRGDQGVRAELRAFARVHQSARRDASTRSTSATRTGRAAAAVQSIKTTFDTQRFELIDGGLQSRSLNLRPFAITNRTGDVVDLVYRDYEEVLLAPFTISPGVVIPTGTYDFHDTGGQLRTGSHRRVAALIRLTDGTFFDGKRTDTVGELTWRPSPKFRSFVSYNYSDVRLPGGNFETRLVRVGLDYVFSSTMSWVNLIQYDNISESIGVNMRWHWIPEAGRELYFVINHNLADADRDNSFASTSSDATAKLNYTFRF